MDVQTPHARCKWGSFVLDVQTPHACCKWGSFVLDIQTSPFLCHARALNSDDGMVVAGYVNSIFVCSRYIDFF